MYHLCEVNSAPIWMTEYDWHRLDNLFSITSFIVLNSILLGTIKYEWVRYTCITVTLILQEKAPFNLFTTLAPILIYFLICLCLRI